MGTIDRRGRSAASRRVALAVDARRDSPKSSSCSRAARTWAARALVGAARFHRHYADIVEPWVRCARVEACIAPPGSNRRNHRQDQAALTVLAHQAGVACRRMHLSVHYHHDDPSDEGTLDGRPKSSRPKSSRRPAGGD